MEPLERNRVPEASGVLLSALISVYVLALSISGCQLWLPPPTDDTEVCDIPPQYVTSVKSPDGAAPLGALVLCPTIPGCSRYAINSISEEAILYLEFDESVASDYSAASFQSAFRRASLQLMFPKPPFRPDVTSVVFCGAPTWFVVDCASDGRLLGYVQGLAENIYYLLNHPDDPNCLSDDIQGICAEYLPDSVVYRVNFDLAFNRPMP